MERLFLFIIMGLGRHKSNSAQVEFQHRKTGKSKREIKPARVQLSLGTSWQDKGSSYQAGLQLG